MANLETVLKRLKEHGVRLNKDKCQFFEDAVEYLGCRVDAQGVHTSAKKLKAILGAPKPRNVQELRSFLGLINYYGKFLPNLATMLHPLNVLVRNSQPWRWSQECTRAFQEAKRKLTEATVLVHFDANLPLRLAGDASAYGVGAVISRHARWIRAPNKHLHLTRCLQVNATTLKWRKKLCHSFSVFASFISTCMEGVSQLSLTISH